MRRKSDPTKEKPYVTFATALNFFDPDQRKMIEHIQKRTNFSDYFKRLVMLDMTGSMFQQKSESCIILTEVEEFDAGLMQELV